MKYSVLYHVFPAPLHVVSRKGDYLWDSAVRKTGKERREQKEKAGREREREAGQEGMEEEKGVERGQGAERKAGRMRRNRKRRKEEGVVERVS